MDGLEHEPVMRADVVRLLLPLPRPGLRFIDATVGLGGHSEALLAAAPPDAVLLGIDRDPEALRRAARRLAPFGDRVHLRETPFSEMGKAADSLGWATVDGIVADLGVSSMQLDEPSRGFSFQSDAPLDMRMDPSSGETAAELLERLDEGELATLLRDLGEEPRARRVARSIKRTTPPPSTTLELRAAVLRALGPVRGRRRDPATLTFQALRIAVNHELEELDVLLDGLPDRLGSRGRVAILAYHSLEDRRVKRTFAHWVKACICPAELLVCRCGGKARADRITRGAHKASEEEIEQNPRARSARLRVIEWLGDVDGNP